jgi:hypothetical protein
MRAMSGADRAYFGNSHLKFGEDFEQEGFEFLIAAIYFIDQQHGRAIGVGYGIEQGAFEQKIFTEYPGLFFGGALGGFLHSDVKQLLRIIPFVKRRRRVQPFITLKSNEASVERSGKHSCDFSLAHSRWAFDQKRLAESHGQIKRRGHGSVGDVGLTAKEFLYVADFFSHSCLLFSESSKIFFRIDVFGEGEIESDFAESFKIGIDYFPCRFVAVQLAEFVEERFCKDHRMAFSAPIRREHYLAVAFSTLLSHAVDYVRADLGLIAEQDHYGIGLRVERG